MNSRCLSTLLLGYAVLLTTTCAVPVNSRSVSVDGQTFDYIVVGGGLSGLVVANRLTENGNGTLPIYCIPPSSNTPLGSPEN
jgi:hypothetical protein